MSSRWYDGPKDLTAEVLQSWMLAGGLVIGLAILIATNVEWGSKSTPNVRLTRENIIQVQYAGQSGVAYAWFEDGSCHRCYFREIPLGLVIVEWQGNAIWSARPDGKAKTNPIRKTDYVPEM